MASDVQSTWQESAFVKMHRTWPGLLLAGVLAAQSPITAPGTEGIVARMGVAQAESRAHLRPFAVVRDYKLFGKEMQTTQSEVVASIRYDPPDVQRYVIQKVNGLGLGELIVRKILESENDVLTHQSASDISAANYAFSFLREEILEGRPCYVLALRPLRKDARLLRGTIWVDAASYLVHRIEGQPAKPPSWWVHDIHLVLELREVNGMWLQTALQSTANVRLLGQHTLISRDTAYQMSGLEASGEASSGAKISSALISSAP